jgi:hypothetical protein
MRRGVLIFWLETLLCVRGMRTCLAVVLFGMRTNLLPAERSVAFLVAFLQVGFIWFFVKG